MVYSEDGNIVLGPYGGYEPLLVEIVNYFETGQVPVSPDETLEIFAFMSAADESKANGGCAVNMQKVLKRAKSI